MNAGTPDGVRLHQAVIDNPDDDAVRLIYADWLEEYGSLERAAVIRGGWRWLRAREFWGWFGTPSLAQRFPGSPSCVVLDPDGGHPGERERVLVGDGRWEFGFRLGFPERVKLPLADWMQYGKALVKEFPLRRVELSDREPEQCGYDKSKWGYWDRGTHPPEDAGDLPRELVIAFGWETDDWTWFKGHNAANDALSAACLLFASS